MKSVFKFRFGQAVLFTGYGKRDVDAVVVERYNSLVLGENMYTVYHGRHKYAATEDCLKEVKVK